VKGNAILPTKKKAQTDKFKGQTFHLFQQRACWGKKEVQVILGYNPTGPSRRTNRSSQRKEKEHFGVRSYPPTAGKVKEPETGIPLENN